MRPRLGWVTVRGLPEADLRSLAEAAGGWVECGPEGETCLVAPEAPLREAARAHGVALGGPAEPEGRVWRVGEERWPSGGPVRIMAVLNLTPDSFSDGGRYPHPPRALERAGQLSRQGAHLLDLGGESTRPGHRPVPVEVEWSRLQPVLSRLAGAFPLPLSVDTRHAEVARRALALGCQVVNDVSGLSDPRMAEVVAAAGASLVVGHWPAEEADPVDVVARVVDDLGRAVEAAVRAGVDRERIAVDPGFGFGKGAEANWNLLRQLGALARLGRPVVVGVSRKRFLTALAGADLEARDRATAAALALAVEEGADVVRVHEPAQVALAVAVAERAAGRR